MASTGSFLSERNVLCYICEDVLGDPVVIPCGHPYCKACITDYWKNINDNVWCPQCEETFDKRPKFTVNSIISEMVQQFRSRKLREECEETEIQAAIQEIQAEILEVKRSVEVGRKDADTVIAGSVQIFTALTRSIEQSQAELIGVIEGKQKAAENQAKSLIEDLRRKIAHMENRISELSEQHSHSEDHHLHQSFTYIDTPPPTHWTKFNTHQSSPVLTMRTVMSIMDTTLSHEMNKKLCDVELRMSKRYAVDVTLDPDTADANLDLSGDGKKVSLGNWKDLPDNEERFGVYACVLGKQGFSSRRFYFEVQVKGKTRWNLGVASESINRKGTCIHNSSNGYWAIGLQNENKYYAYIDIRPIQLHVRQKVQTVGVFVDYEEGLVCFYDVEARVHLYSFTGCSFTEKLYPYFSLCDDSDGTNSAPLIICPVNIEDDLSEDGGSMSRSRQAQKRRLN